MARIAWLVAALALVLPAAGSSGRQSRLVYGRAGVSVVLPPSWHLAADVATPCSNPAQLLALRGHGGLVVIQEYLPPLFRRHRLPGRPRHFRLDGRPRPQECCNPVDRAGWVLAFEDRGRGFYVYVYPGVRGSRSEILAVLASLRISRA